MVDMNLLLGLPVKVELKEGTYNKSKFKGLFLKNYKLKDFLNETVGYNKYMSWCASIVLKPKDFADELWVKYKMYYKDLDDWAFLIGQCVQPDESGVIKDSIVLEGLKFMFEYDFSPRINPKGETADKRYFLDIYDNKGNWLATIDKDNFDSIRDTVKKVNHIQQSELSEWNYAFHKHEKKALEYYYNKKHDKNKPKDKYKQTLETVMRFLKTETNREYADMMEESLYEIYSAYAMKVDTLQSLALNIGIYNGMIKIDSDIENRLIFGVERKNEQVKNLVSGENIENVMK